MKCRLDFTLFSQKVQIKLKSCHQLVKIKLAEGEDVSFLIQETQQVTPISISRNWSIHKKMLHYHVLTKAPKLTETSKTPHPTL